MHKDRSRITCHMPEKLFACLWRKGKNGRVRSILRGMGSRGTEVL